jgi:hypothetical protein
MTKDEKRQYAREYYKKNIAPNPQLKAQADEFIRTNMTPQQYAQSIQQAQAQLLKLVVLG